MPLKSINDIVYPFGSVCDIMVIIIGDGHGDLSSNPGQSYLHFT